MAKIHSHGEMIEMAQKAELEVIYERTQLEIAENKQKHHVRAKVIERLTTSANVTVQDLIEPTANGQIKFRDLTTVPVHVARVVKKLKITTTGKGKSQVQTVEVELNNHLDYDAVIGKYTGLLSDKHLHLHNHAAAANQDGKPAPEKLAELTEEQLRAQRARLEKEVQALDVRDTPTEPETAP